MEQKVAVCMSCYNGEKYIREQLNSIMNQKITNGSLELFIRDDGSKDSTINIIKEYMQKYNNIHLINVNENINYGCTKSFFNCLNYAYNKYENEFNYYCFADQDDFWLENKIDAAIKKLSEINSTNGKLYYSNKTIVDENLNFIRKENIKFWGNFIECTFTNNAYGCTMVFDKKFAKILLKGLPQIKVLHDAWAYRLAKSIDSTIVFDKESYILYRQHSNNVIGAQKEKGIWYYFKNIFITLFGKREHYLQKFFIELNERYGDKIQKSKNSLVINQIINYNHNYKDKLKLIFNREAKSMRKKVLFKVDI